MISQVISSKFKPENLAVNREGINAFARMNPRLSKRKTWPHVLGSSLPWAFLTVHIKW
jgi:hypothetical protein